MSAALVVERLEKWRALLSMVRVREPCVAYRQLRRELGEELQNAIVLRTREETGAKR